jgi:hypothetical protein
MSMLIISDRLKNKGVCMRLLRYMQDTFLELETTLNDEFVRGKINESVSIHIVWVSNKIHSDLCRSSAFLFLEGIQAHGHELKIKKWVTYGLRLLQAL